MKPLTQPSKSFSTVLLAWKYWFKVRVLRKDAMVAYTEFLTDLHGDRWKSLLENPQRSHEPIPQTQYPSGFVTPIVEPEIEELTNNIIQRADAAELRAEMNRGQVYDSDALQRAIHEVLQSYYKKQYVDGKHVGLSVPDLKEIVKYAQQLNSLWGHNIRLIIDTPMFYMNMAMTQEDLNNVQAAIDIVWTHLNGQISYPKDTDVAKMLMVSLQKLVPTSEHRFRTLTIKPEKDRYVKSLDDKKLTVILAIDAIPSKPMTQPDDEIVKRVVGPSLLAFSVDFGLQPDESNVPVLNPSTIDYAAEKQSDINAVTSAAVASAVTAVASM